jgi:hypothetical protein
VSDGLLCGALSSSERVFVLNPHLSFFFFGDAASVLVYFSVEKRQEGFLRRFIFTFVSDLVRTFHTQL